MPEETITVTVPDEGIEGEAGTAVVTSSLSDSPEVGIEDLRRQLAEERQARERAQTVAEEESRRRAEAERRASENAGVAEVAHRQAQEREYESLVNTISATQAKITQAESDLAKAMEEGDYAKASKLQTELGRLAGRLENLESGKGMIEEQRKNAPSPRPVAPRPAHPHQEVDWTRPWTQGETERVLSAYSPQTAAWIRNHQQFATDPGYRRQVIALDGLARAKGIQPDTDAYFRFVESQLEDQSPVPAQASQPAAQAPRQAPVPAAPPSRQTPSSQPDYANASPRSVTLTREEREMAQIMFAKQSPSDPDPEVAYATYKIQVEREGKMKR